MLGIFLYYDSIHFDYKNPDKATRLVIDKVRRKSKNKKNKQRRKRK